MLILLCAYYSICPFLPLMQDGKGLYAQSLPPQSPQLPDSTLTPNIIPAHLKDPPSVRTEVRYDHHTNLYIIERMIGDMVVGIPIVMTPKEYMEYRLKQMQNSHFRDRNASGDSSPPPVRPTPLSRQRARNNQGATIFGPGGVRLTTQGSIEISAGLKRDVTNNPTLPQRARVRNRFDFDQQIQLNMNAKVGDKIDFNINYDSDATFDMDARQIKLAYRGDEDEIIRNIEAGNVSMTTTNSLINGGAALFGIKADLQFGKLHINTLFSQQQSETQTVNSRGGVQTTPFEFNADQYDENRHFFLGYYFRESYDHALGKLPYVQSPVSITRMEVWVTNKQGNYDQVRNLVAFADLGEYNTIHNPFWTPQGGEEYPYNRANSMYEQLVTTYAGARDITATDNTLPDNIVRGIDYEKLENARLLNPSEYTFQTQLGYISLQMPLQADEVLAVAFEYTRNGQVYQVGEFSDDVGGGALFMKLLKPVSLSPRSYTWDLMMKNIYSVGYSAYDLQKEHFKLQITYQSDTTGIYLNYLPNSGIEEKLLLQVMNLDRLNSRNDPYPDGIFDFLDGYTIDSGNGRIIFPVVEPFGSHLRERIGNDVVADRFVYQELYDSTLTTARQVPEKNKFRMSGEYRGSSGAEINLNAMNVPRGSVRVTAGGITLTEGVDYTVDYLSGVVRIINRSIIDAGTSVSVTLENRMASQMQRKTLMGVNLLYNFSKNFSAGATLMHYYEKPLIMKTVFGDESAKNTLWGLNMDYKKESIALTNLLNLLPFVEATAPSQLSARLEFAHLIAGHYKNKYTGGYSYLDDFESSASGIDLRNPYGWSLAATPYNNTSTGLFPEAILSNNIEYGKNRAQLAWFYIDGMFTYRNSGLTPSHIRNDAEQLSDHRVREIYEREIFPGRDAYFGQPATIPVLNLSYYPNERGPYNLDTNVDSEGRLLNPQDRWGGITRRMDVRDFEAANIEYIELWLMDPFVNDTLGTSQGGDLYFNLGEISEDVLKDGKKFFENGLPVDGDTTAVGYSVWGKYPRRQSTVYAFDNSRGDESRRLQDVGLNGLSSEEEKSYPAYRDYLETLRPRLSGETLSRMQEDAHSPLNDPSGDSFRHYRGTEQDRQQLSILDRYKYFNGTEGNSLSPEDGNPYSTASRATPDIEDIDNDNTLNENESYYQYKISLRPEALEVGTNFIADKRETSVRLRNGTDGKVTWYQFKIPIREYQVKTGNIEGFNNIRFMRMFLTGFEEPQFLRFATLELKRSEWRNYRNDLASGGAVTGSGNLDISTVNIEENGRRTPVNYVLPPGVTRILDPGQPQLRQENEQSLSLKVTDLDPDDSRAVYKGSMYDLRRYKRLQMFVHAERLPEDPGTLQDGDLSIFLRLGSDYRNNYYEYEIPLRLTPEGQYSSNNLPDQEKVWPGENMLDFPLTLLTNLKLARNADKQHDDGVSFFIPYTRPDPEKQENRITITGNPSLAEVKVLMIGIRNNTDSHRSAEIWVNELRLSEFDEKGGWAAQGNVQLALSDIGTVSFSGRKETAGFGALSQSLLERRDDDFTSVQLALNLEMGRFLPKQFKLSAPLYFSYSNQLTAPLYDPFNQDILLSESLQHSATPFLRDSIRRIATTGIKDVSFSLSNVKMDIKSKHPMPYDPANFSFTYARNENQRRSPDTEYATLRDFRIQANYDYTPQTKTWEPFRNSNSNSGWTKPLRAMNLNYLPNNIRLSSDLVRHYEEVQLRDLNAYAEGITQAEQKYLSFSRNFFWNRDISITWDLTRNLRTAFRSGTVAEIEEPYLQVNKELNRSDYSIWKDSVMQSIRELGKPLNYAQTADVTYTLPFAHIPLLDWISSSAAYHSRYRWERGAIIEDERIGNFLQNDLSFTLNNRFNMISLYNKIPFLREINNRFAGEWHPQKDNRQGNEGNIRQAGTPPGAWNSTGQDIARYAAQTLMMLRSVSINWGYRSRSDIPGFEGMIGDFFGQAHMPGRLQPGWKFAFGFEGGERFVEKLKTNNLLVLNENNITPAIYNETRNLRLDASLEPLPGLRIDLNALYEKNHRTEIQYMFDDMPKKRGGSFAMTIQTLSSAFETSKADNNYRSPAFEKFLGNRQIIAERTRQQYAGTNYPTGGFLTGSDYEGEPFDSSTGDVDINSADVLIPAFLAAYTGKDPGSVGLTPFPDISALLPNWLVSYNLIRLLPQLGEHMQSLTLTHQYLSQYRIGSFESFMSWVPLSDGSDLGYIRDAVSGSPVPSSPFNISSASIQESFNPLIEARGVWDNNISLHFRINRSRALNLNIASYQIVETSDRDIVTGLGYRIQHFNRIIGLGANSTQRERRRPSAGKTTGDTQPDDRTAAFSNDLNIRLDISRKITHAMIRRIEEGFTQATSGIRTTTISFSADYSLSRLVTLRAFFDKMVHRPLVSSGSYPTSTTSAGISLRFNMDQN
ncbi:cell surface protein SprA [Proteiniphilum acetatigenes]|uniref:T9SS outer membrane translocon Sov/SprA n=1 Tax=Proteiniphilum acetatigenes TaxID=294710 RepID=UPI00146DCB40|nr:cell surface protein SprA [Proteiniphilum acetatigenes]